MCVCPRLGPRFGEWSATWAHLVLQKHGSDVQVDQNIREPSTLYCSQPRPVLFVLDIRRTCRLVSVDDCFDLALAPHNSIRAIVHFKQQTRTMRPGYQLVAVVAAVSLVGQIWGQNQKVTPEYLRQLRVQRVQNPDQFFYDFSRPVKITQGPGGSLRTCGIEELPTLAGMGNGTWSSNAPPSCRSIRRQWIRVRYRGLTR